jgi:hypothetical protein
MLHSVGNVSIYVQFVVEHLVVDQYYPDLNKYHINLHYIDNYNPTHYHARTNQPYMLYFFPKLTVSFHFSYKAKTFSLHPQ